MSIFIPLNVLIKEIASAPPETAALAISDMSVTSGDNFTINPINSLHIGEKTKLLGPDDEIISITDFKPGNAIEVTLKDAFTEEIPFYYPTVYEIKMIESGS